MKPDRAAGAATAASAAAKAATTRTTRTTTATPTPRSRPRAAAWLAGALLLAACGQAAAQYMWIDDKGIKQLSDRPPPPSVPQKRILKAPGKDKFNPTADAAAGESGADGDKPAMAADAPAGKLAPTLGERNAAYNKRKAEAALAAQQAGEDKARKAEIAANCENARNNQRALDQGVRMSTYDKNGERGFMSDAERAEAARKNKQVLAQCQ